MQKRTIEIDNTGYIGVLLINEWAPEPNEIRFYDRNCLEAICSEQRVSDYQDAFVAQNGKVKELREKYNLEDNDILIISPRFLPENVDVDEEISCILEEFVSSEFELNLLNDCQWL